MSNSTYGRVWVADTIGIITRDPIWVQAVVMIPNAASDAANFYYWDTTDTIATGIDTTYDQTYTGSITNTDTLTISSGSIMPSAITDGSIFEITETTGATTTGKPMVVKTAGSGTAVTIHKIPVADVWTTEGPFQYSWKTYQNRLAFGLVSGSDKDMAVLYFGPNGFRFPNLALDTITSEGSTKVYIYLK